MRVVIDVTKPLLCSKKLNIGLPTLVWVRFTYERLPDFCFCYGKLGHNHIECTDWVGLQSSMSKMVSLIENGCMVIQGERVVARDRRKNTMQRSLKGACHDC